MGNTAAGRSTAWASLIESARQGDDNAFGEICDHFAGYLLLTTRKLENGLSAKFGVSDIVQQTLIEARRDIASFQGDSENELQVWLARLVRNNLIDATRRYRDTDKRDVARESMESNVRLKGNFPGQVRTASSMFSQQETDEQMLHALACLPENWRRVVELRLWEELSFAEIGKELDISNASARKIMERALKELRKNLSTDYVDRSSQPR